MSAKSPVYLTQKGLDELKLELDDLINEIKNKSAMK